MTAALKKSLPRIPILTSAFLLGSVAPDLPLWFLSIGSIIYYHFALGLNIASTSHYIFEDLYFHNPFWISAHNTLHSPVLLFIGLGLVWRRRRYIGSRHRWLFWFLVACLFHTTVDIFTHANDGPLLLFPLDWTVRFHSAISYWDTHYHGQEFRQFERTLDAVLLIYLVGSPVIQYFHRKFSSRTTKS